MVQGGRKGGGRGGGAHFFCGWGAEGTATKGFQRHPAAFISRLYSQKLKVFPLRTHEQPNIILTRLDTVPPLRSLLLTTTDGAGSRQLHPPTHSPVSTGLWEPNAYNGRCTARVGKVQRSIRHRSKAQSGQFKVQLHSTGPVQSSAQSPIRAQPKEVHFSMGAGAQFLVHNVGFKTQRPVQCWIG